jgi:hypothetical protein
MEAIFKTYTTQIEVKAHLFGCYREVDGTWKLEGDLVNRQANTDAESRVCAPSARPATRLRRHR